MFVAGGVWRVKWILHPDKGTYIVAACMHGGCTLIETNDIPDSVISPCPSHTKYMYNFENSNKTLVYGIDILSIRRNEGDDVSNILNNSSHVFNIVNCSFYENIIQIWDVFY